MSRLRQLLLSALSHQSSQDYLEALRLFQKLSDDELMRLVEIGQITIQGDGIVIGHGNVNVVIKGEQVKELVEILPEGLLGAGQGSALIDSKINEYRKQKCLSIEKTLNASLLRSTFNLRSEEIESILAMLMKQLWETHASYLLLGDYGIGKTTLCQSLVNQFNQSTDGLSFLITLRSIRTSELINGILRSIASDLHITAMTLPQFNLLTSKHRVILVLDGLDELFWKEKEENCVARAAAEVLDLCEICNIVITSRPNFFLSTRSAASYFSSRLNVISIQLLDEKCVTSFLHENGRFDLANLIQQNIRLKELARRPIALDMILKSNPSELREHIECEAQLYGTYVDRCLLRDKGRRAFFNSESMKKLLERAALLCVSTNRVELSISDIRDIANSSICNDMDRVDGIMSDIIGNSLLIHSDQQGFFRFSHQSVFEYFVACAIIDIVRKGQIPDELIEVLIYMLTVIGFIRDLLQPDDTNLLLNLIVANSGRKRAFYITISRKLIEQSPTLRQHMLKLFADPYLEAASKVELIYALYRFCTNREKGRLAKALENNVNEYIAYSKAQFTSSGTFLDWARGRLKDHKFADGREFLYFFPLALAGDKSDEPLILLYLSSNEPLVKRQAEQCLKQIKQNHKRLKW